jgi:hypothetical protein
MKLFHVTCHLPNASNLINGIKFEVHKDIEGAVHTVEAVEADVAAMFKGIKGYVIEDASPKAPAAVAVTFPPTDEQVDAMTPKAVADMLLAQKIDLNVPELKERPSKVAKLKEIAAAARAIPADGNLV